MPLAGPSAADTDIAMIADHARRISRLEQRTTSTSGFDPNEDPVIIGFAAATGGGASPDAPGSGPPHDVIIGRNATTRGVGTDGQVAVGYGATAGDLPGTSNANNTAVGCASTAGSLASPAVDAVENTACGFGTSASGLRNLAAGAQAVAVGPEGNTALGAFANAANFGATTITHATAAGWQANAQHDHASAFGADSATTAANQVMLGSAADFVEIPGDSSGAPNGLVLTDTATGTRYIVQITSGALVLSAAP